MAVVAFLSGAVPTLLQRSLSQAFTPELLGLTVISQPILSAIIAKILGIQRFPGVLACIGVLLYIPGLFLVREEASKQSLGEMAVDGEDGEAQSTDSDARLVDRHNESQLLA